MKDIIDKLNNNKFLSDIEWKKLISDYTYDTYEYAVQLARDITREEYGDKVFYRGIIEFSNICKNDCYYCGIRCSNKNVERYRLSEADILICCKEGYELGYRTFVLQSGEDAYWSDGRMVNMISKIRKQYPDCAITLSIGERSYDSYLSMFDAGADRFLLRHETADSLHYSQIHPHNMSFDNRVRCLWDLKNIGYQTGCGMMVGTPYQTVDSIVKDMKLISEFKPEMVGIGPFIPHKDTPFASANKGSVELTLFLLSLTRIMLPRVLLPATTALGTAETNGRIQGLQAGCNVVMPNLSPVEVRKKYMLYDNKSGIELTPEKSLQLIKDQIKTIGLQLVSERGDYI